MVAYFAGNQLTDISGHGTLKLCNILVSSMVWIYVFSIMCCRVFLINGCYITTKATFFKLLSIYIAFSPVKIGTADS